MRVQMLTRGSICKKKVLYGRCYFQEACAARTLDGEGALGDGGKLNCVVDCAYMHTHMWYLHINAKTFAGVYKIKRV